MNSSSPMVTVVMPVFNGEKYLRYSVESILRQTYTNFELLIINDGSTDRSFEIVKSYHDPRIRFIDNKKNLGLIDTRNLGLREARGNYIALLDSDDVTYPTRLVEQVAAMENDPDLTLLGSWIYCIDEHGNRLNNMAWQPQVSSDRIPSALLFENCFATSSIFIRKSALPATRYRDEYPLAEDYDLYVRIAQKSKIANLPRFLSCYRTHGESISKKKSQQMEECVRNIISCQLESIGIKATKREMDVHRHIIWPTLPCDALLIEEAELWLRKLYAANSKTGNFRESYFEAELCDRWFALCNNSSHLGIWVLRRFYSSVLCAKIKLGWRPTIKFAIKCMLKYRRRTLG